MNTLNETGLRYPRRIETTLYALLAAGLIGQVLYHSAPVSQEQSVAVLAGALCGILAVCNMAPVTTALSTWMEDGRTAGATERPRGATVFSFVRRDPGHGPGDTGDTRRAA